MFNPIDKNNTKFDDFQLDSETLVSGMIFADEDGTVFENEKDRAFGMGRYFNIKGTLFDYDSVYISNDYYAEGYSTYEKAIVVNSNYYTEKVALVGNYIKFSNGDLCKIIDTKNEWSNKIIYLDSSDMLSAQKNGSLDDAEFLDANMQPLPSSSVIAYKSQFGLNGTVFKIIARQIGKDKIKILNLLCAVSLAFVLSLIIILLYDKYNLVMAICFFAVSCLSPWIVNFARNLYWVEFTWFVPMLIGLLCAWKVESRIVRCVSYVLVFISILIKCLCGYEYISTIMMSAIAFLLADFVGALFEKDTRKALLLFRTLIIFGCFALAGFIVAILIHATNVGAESIGAGLNDIYNNLVVRRTVGSATDGADLGITSSINVSIMETLARYFRFDTEIIAGISGSLFSCICILPLCVLIIDACRKKLRFDEAALYVVFFLAAISWFCLAKAHSYIHTHMNFVLWYLGFVQICFYIILNAIVRLFRKGESKQ